MFKVSKHDAKSLRWWYLHKEDIDFSPSYQRKGGLWSVRDKSYLIDSMINGYDVPKVYLADFTLLNTSLNEKQRSYAVIDGRQRLEAIVDFFEDSFSLDKNFVYDANPSLNIGGLTYSDLRKNHAKVLEKFDEFNLDVMSVVSDDEKKINELFVRLNKSKPVNGAEIRNAMHGKAPKLIREISMHDFFENKINFNKNRGQAQNAAAKLLLIEFRGKFVDLKKTNLDKLIKEAVQSETDNFNIAEQGVLNVLDNMSDVFVNNDPLLSSQGILPVYYWLIRKLGSEPDIRPFLVDFERRRKVLHLTSVGRNEVFLNYELMNRSTNDQGSLFGRFDILDKAYNEFHKASLLF